MEFVNSLESLLKEELKTIKTACIFELQFGWSLERTAKCTAGHKHKELSDE